MKLAIILLVLVPLAMADRNKRTFLDTIGVDINAVRNVVQDLLDLIGTDSTEQLCENTCHSLIIPDETHFLHMYCTPICRSLQSLANMFHLRPQPTSATGA